MLSVQDFKNIFPRCQDAAGWVPDFTNGVASMRRAADKGMLAIIGAIAVGAMTALWAGIVSYMMKGH